MTRDDPMPDPPPSPENETVDHRPGLLELCAYAAAAGYLVGVTIGVTLRLMGFL